MTELPFLEKVALVAAVTLPVFNIPLILKIIKRKSSEDLSLCWVLGVWICILLMLPAGVQSPDIVWRVFNYVNATFFTAVVITTLKYRKKSKNG